MVERASEAAVARLCERIGVEYGPRVREFLSGIAETTEVDGELCFVRRAPVLRMPHNEAGMALKDRFTQHEVARSIEKPATGEIFPPGGTFRHSAMVALPGSALDRVQQRLADLITEVEVASNAGGQLDNPSCTPYFFTVIISGREEYNGNISP
jgi:hypothetical protein